MATPHQLKAGRRSTDDPDLAVVIERLDTLDQGQAQILRHVTDTNSRVSELEVKERIRQDREEQKAIRDAASEATKYRIEEQAKEERDRIEAAAKEARERLEYEREHAEQTALTRTTWRMMRIAAAIGAAPGALVELARLIFTGHL